MLVRYSLTAHYPEQIVYDICTCTTTIVTFLLLYSTYYLLQCIYHSINNFAIRARCARAKKVLIAPVRQSITVYSLLRSKFLFLETVTVIATYAPGQFQCKFMIASLSQSLAIRVRRSKLVWKGGDSVIGESGRSSCMYIGTNSR